MKKVIWILPAALLAASLFYACGGGGGGSPSAGSGAIALFATDAKVEDISGEQEVNVTIDNVSLTGPSASCSLLTTQTVLNLSHLSDTIQLLSVANCPESEFNRIHIVFEKNLTLMGTTPSGSVFSGSCSFTSFKDEENRPNALDCSGNTCSLDVTGAVNVFANHQDKVGLDFVLKDFDLTNFGGANCTATMKVSPLHASDMDDRKNSKGFKEAVTGGISDLNATSKTFAITKGHSSFTVNYAGVSQTGLDQLLQFAQTNNLKVQVKTSDIDLSTNTITASSIVVNIEGTIAGLDTTNKTFQTTVGSGQITIDFSSAIVEGTLVNGANVEIKVQGFDGAKYIAKEVEIETGTGLEN